MTLGALIGLGHVASLAVAAVALALPPGIAGPSSRFNGENQDVRYFSHFGPAGPLKGSDAPGCLGVLSAHDQHLPVGGASRLVPDEDGNAVFRLTVHGAALEGRWLLIEHEFKR